MSMITIWLEFSQQGITSILSMMKFPEEVTWPVLPTSQHINANLKIRHYMNPVESADNSYNVFYRPEFSWQRVSLLHYALLL